MNEHGVSQTNHNAANLRLNVTAHGVEVSAELKDYVNRRAHFGLGRFAGRIRAIQVRLADINGPRGGLDKSCDIRVDAGLPHEVVVHERQDNVYSAVALAMERAERVLKRRLSMARAGKRTLRTGYSWS